MKTVRTKFSALLGRNGVGLKKELPKNPHYSFQDEPLPCRVNKKLV